MEYIFEILTGIFTVGTIIFAVLWWIKKSEQDTGKKKFDQEREALSDQIETLTTQKNIYQEESIRTASTLSSLQNEHGRVKESLQQSSEKLLTLQTQMKAKQEDIIRMEEQIKNSTIKNTELETKLANEREEKSSLEGKGKSVFVQNTKLEEENKMLKQERDELRGKVTTFESKRERMEKEFLEKVEKLEHAREKLEKEQHRVVREDEEEQKSIQENQDRIWNEHENLVLTQLKEASQIPEIGFACYDNTNLPAEFDGTLKPDFLIGFLGQYIVFDAKKSKNPKIYVDAQVKSTAKKCKGNTSIYSTIFFVMPQEEVNELKKRYFFEDGFSFFVIAPDSILPVLSLLKKITEYKNIEDFDPQDRDAIASLFAHYDKHISFQNAANLVMAKKSIELMDSKNLLPEAFVEEIATKKQSIKDIRLNPSEIKKFSENPALQAKTMKDLTKPKAGVEEEVMENAESLF